MGRVRLVTPRWATRERRCGNRTRRLPVNLHTVSWMLWQGGAKHCSHERYLLTPSLRSTKIQIIHFGADFTSVNQRTLFTRSESSFSSIPDISEYIV